jgi:hypothetical protein
MAYLPEVVGFNDVQASPGGETNFDFTRSWKLSRPEEDKGGGMLNSRAAKEGLR